VRARGRWVGLAVLSLAAAACATSGTGESKPERGADAGNSVVVGDAAMRDGGVVLPAWLAYGVAKAGSYQARRPPPANDSADDFYLELAGRQAMNQFWREKRTKPDRELDRQVEIEKAGLLPELVIAIHGRPGWTIPGATIAKLRLEEFAASFAGEYSNEMAVALKLPNGRIVAPVPGADFPDPRPLPIAPSSCHLAIGDRRAAWERWKAIAPRLGGRPISASSPAQFGRQLLALKREAGTPPDVTWVSDRVGHLAFLDGYCAVEARNWPLAIEMLGRTVALSPASADPRLELAGALTSAGRLDEGLRHADTVIATTKDGCAAGVAWRKRGYILIEMGAFEAARAAYEKSLTIDPGNPIALSELQTIEKAMKQPGDWRTKPQPGQPPFDPIVLTRCREGKPAGK
jgi:tetratricopeptide (TPR) repeat protein